MVSSSRLGAAGSLLLTLGTLSVYVAFAASQQKFLLVSDMFQRWPLAGSLTFGVGNTMLGLALYSKQSSVAVVVCMASAWAVIASSEYFGQEWIRAVHFLAVFLFLLTSYLVFAGAAGAQRFPALKAVLTFFSLLAVLSGAMLGTADKGSNAGRYWLWRQTMAAAEVALLAVYFVGYVNVFFLSWIE